MAQKSKKNHIINLFLRNTADNKQFLKTVKPFFFNKSDSNEGIT